MEAVRLKCGFKNGIDVGAMRSKGGLSLGWKGNSLVSLRSFSSSHIDVDIQDSESGGDWRLTGFYGNPEERFRVASWDLLKHLSWGDFTPWVLLGDFNEITSSFEKKGGRLRSERQMHAFRSILEDCSLHDLGFVGRWFTWERGKFSDTNIRERLDRGVATLDWINFFPSYQVQHLNHSFSDHCPVLLNTMKYGGCDGGNKDQIFRFEAQWCLDGSFEELVRKWWADIPDSIPQKLAKLGSQIQCWSKSRAKEDRKNRVNLENRLQFLFNQDPTDENLAEITDVQMGLNFEADKEELLWEQRARINWLKHGDRNTSYFHRMAVYRQLRSRITELEDGNGRCFSSTEDCLKLATNYFISLFSASEMGSDDHVFGLVEKKVTESMNESLLKAFSEEEIISAVKMMAPLKAPGVDRFSVMFFQRYWHIIGPKISSYCLSILRGESQLQDINRTRIVLLPKVEKLRFLSQSRPISLCTVIYKIVAKVVVNRMSTILGDVIDEAQWAFIPGRLISDNVLIAYDILHSLKQKKTGNAGNFALKLDMSKAYDRVEWNFLAGMMTKLGFHTDWVVLVMRCVCSISYSVSLNGDCGE
ncbi:hypothetical protein J1N35_030433 [Gossypium stocksii]|uniref:Reverse transcriptase domain-containing protein n=1 Tax=Gossypium stocksii TaxID=47602 RepID=A0A9D3UZQ7_9ROSI|nr:hypothetical protein J1N35_030433 [Gossypium stocksii]